MPKIDDIGKTTVPVTFQCAPALGKALKSNLLDGRTIQAEVIARLSESLGIPVEYKSPGRPWPKKVAAVKKKTAKKSAKKP